MSQLIFIDSNKKDMRKTLQILTLGTKFSLKNRIVYS